MIKSFKIRIYPTKEQEREFWEHIGSCRYIWNYMIDLQNENYKNGGQYLSAYDMSKEVTKLKSRECNLWLNDISKYSLDTTCSDLDKSYKRFFDKKGNYPKFKGKKNRKQSFPIRSDRFYFKDEKFVKIEKIGKVKYKTDFNISIGRNACKFRNTRIKYDDVRSIWMLSFGIECESQTPTLSDSAMGIDLGIKNLAIVSFNNECIVFEDINRSEKIRFLEKKILRIKKDISRKYEASVKRTGRYEKSKNIIKKEKELKRLHRRLYGIRNNYIHQTTRKLVNMLPNCVVMEDLDIAGLLKESCKTKSRHIADQKWGEFIRQMEYKCALSNIPFIKADRFFPSSKTCSCCGYIDHNLKLSDRVYRCPECGLVIDRDYNAAINLMRYAA